MIHQTETLRLLAGVHPAIGQGPHRRRVHVPPGRHRSDELLVYVLQHRLEDLPFFGRHLPQRRAQVFVRPRLNDTAPHPEFVQ